MSRNKNTKQKQKASAPMVVNMANYTSPIVIENKQKDWVEYGVDNNYLQYLLDRFRGSPTNNAIITGISESIVGKGLTSPYQKYKPQEYAKAMLLFNKENTSRWAFDLKCFGYYVMIVIRNKKLNDVAAVDYSPVQNWRAGLADENGVISEWWYSDDWTQEKKKEYEPVSHPAFDSDKKDAMSVHVVRPYRSGTFYYPSVDYQGALQYAHIEEEISNFHLNNIMNAFVPSVLINFNNGAPGEEEQRKIEKNITDKWTGSSNGGKIVVSFNDDKERAATIETLQVSDLDKQYQFLSTESVTKIMVGHRVTSPLFFGIRDSAGLGSNADEIKNAWVLYENTVLNPFRDIMTESFEYILSQFDHFIQLSFVSNTPVDFVDETQGISEESGDTPTGGNIDALAVDKEASYNGAQIASALQIMEAVSLGTLSKDQAITFLIQMLQFDPEVAKKMFSSGAAETIAELKSHKYSHLSDHKGLELWMDETGEEVDENEWELIDERKVDYDLEPEMDIRVDLATKVISGDSRPISEQDNKLFKVRYSYSPKTTGADSRDFCTKMTKSPKVFRKEDIERAGDKAVNPGWGPKGADTYSIWLYKGGGDCHHYWMRQTYLRLNNKKISVNEARRLINKLPPEDRSKAKLPVNDPKVAKRPTDMPHSGFLPSNKRKGKK